ncbi:MAG: PAS domain S-box protein, partial [Candidatus Aquicultor sp.]
MSWMIPSEIATMSCIFILVLVYSYLYRQNRERFLAIWTLGWAIYLLRFVFEFWMIIGQKSPALLIANQISSLLSGLFLLWGTHEFLGKPMSKWWKYGSALGIVWIITGVYMHASFSSLALPTFTFLGVTNIWTGIAFLRSHTTKGVGNHVTGWAFVVWGAHKIDYPFIRPLVWLAPWGYLLGSVLEITIAIGILLVYFQKIQKDLGASEERFRRLVELSPDGIIVHCDGKIVYTNDAVLRIFGASSEDQIIGKPVLDFVNPESRQVVIGRIQALKRGESVGLIEEQFIAIDGQVIDVEVAA